MPKGALARGALRALAHLNLIMVGLLYVAALATIASDVVGNCCNYSFHWLGGWPCYMGEGNESRPEDHIRYAERDVRRPEEERERGKFYAWLRLMLQRGCPDPVAIPLQGIG